jgi:CBS domain-containing protein
LPALPLDGGRVLRAALWKTRGDLSWSTRVAAEIGRGFGYLLITFGLFQFFFASSFGGAWFAFIGWFLLLAASQENRSLAARQALGGLHVRDLMVREPVTVGPDLTLAEFVDTVVWVKRYTTYPVTEDGKALGLLPFRRVAEVPRRDWESVRVRDSMLTGDQLPRLSADEELVEALAELGESEVQRGLVVDGERLVGLLSVTDIARALDVGSPRLARRATDQ